MKILHLYADLLNMYGDYGNVTVLKKHLEDQGAEVTVETRSLGESFDLADVDFLYMGSGTESKQHLALRDLLRYRKELKEYLDSDRPALFTGNSMELLGRKVNGEEALGLLDFETEFTDKRFTGDAIVKNDVFGEVVGFINKCSLIKGGKEESLFTYVFKDSNLTDNDYEGVRYHNCFGTHIIGPVLVKNPSMMKYIVKLILKEKEYQEISYPFEEDSYQVTLEALKGRMK